MKFRMLFQDVVIFLPVSNFFKIPSEGLKAIDNAICYKLSYDSYIMNSSLSHIDCGFFIKFSFELSQLWLNFPFQKLCDLYKEEAFINTEFFD